MILLLCLFFGIILLLVGAGVFFFKRKMEEGFKVCLFFALISFMVLCVLVILSIYTTVETGFINKKFGTSYTVDEVLFFHKEILEDTQKAVK